MEDNFLPVDASASDLLCLWILFARIPNLYQGGSDLLLMLKKTFDICQENKAVDAESEDRSLVGRAVEDEGSWRNFLSRR